jgi:hypothetical protein
MAQANRRRRERMEKPPLATRGAAAARQDAEPTEAPTAPRLPAPSQRHPLIAVVLAEARERRAATARLEDERWWRGMVDGDA